MTAIQIITGTQYLLSLGTKDENKRNPGEANHFFRRLILEHSRHSLSVVEFGHFLSAKGAVSSQPGATPQEEISIGHEG
jgi:hypothetical protein